MSRLKPVYRFTLASILGASVIPHPALAQAAESASRSYFFGDSDLEQGNFQILAGRTADQQSPYFCDEGLCRDSNGPVWAEYLVPDVEPVLAAGSTEGSLNFAVSGAHMTTLGDPDLGVETGVTRQIDQFLSLTSAGALHVNPQDRFFIHAGTNDMLRILQGEASETVSSAIVGAASDHVDRLAQQGARTIVVGLVQPVDVLPFLGAPELADVRSLASDFVTQTNASLRATLSDQRRALPDGTRLVLVDQPAFFRHLQANSTRLGFTSFSEACYDPASGQLCSTDTGVQNSHVFFDGNHLTGAAHSLLADWYRATLRAADGSAGALAIALPEAALVSAQSSAAQADSARRLMAGTGARNFIYGASLNQTLRLANASGNALELKQEGAVIGVQWSPSDRMYGTLAGAFVDQHASMGTLNAFRMREFAVMASAGLRRRQSYLGIHARYAAPRITSFQRDVGALGLIARAGEKTTGVRRLGFGLEGGTRFQWHRVVLTSDSRLDYDHVRVDGFSETAADGLNLDYGRQTIASLTLNTGARLGWILADKPNRLRVMPYVSVSSSARLSGKSHALTSTLQGGLAAPAELRQATPGHDRTEIGGGLELGLGKRLNVGLAVRHGFGGGISSEQHIGISLGIGF